MTNFFGNFRENVGPVPEIIDPVFAKISPKRSFCMTENERFGLVFGKTGSINSGTGGTVHWRYGTVVPECCCYVCELL
jgi:hypothetical protein